MHHRFRSAALACGVLFAVAATSQTAVATFDAAGAAIRPYLTIIGGPSIDVVAPSGGASYTQDERVAADYSCSGGGGATVVACSGTVPNGAPIDTSTLGSHTFAVQAEDSNGSKVVQNVIYTVVAPPNTVLRSHPSKVIKTKKAKARVKFSFTSTRDDARFKCKLDKGPFAFCSSPKAYTVKPGKHKFSVQAESAGAADKTPATFKFKVIKLP